MLPKLLSVPQTKDEWDTFSFNNKNEIARINAAILARFGTSLPSYPIDPINFEHIFDWLEYNSQSHIAFNDVLGLQSHDLLSIDLQNESQKIAWIFLNYSEIRDAEAALGI
jgi:hypothetical protein